MECLARLESVAKVYPRVARPMERMRAFGALLLGREPSLGAEVLTDVDLVINRGESLGIIGENGAGKSTLLKILTGVIKPSRGTVQVNAHTSALLELGAGFHPDFSGVDNVRMKASLLGLGKRQLQERMEDILAFADIGDYIHEPVKHYSSGMVVRLGFAVVAASRPELLITDEVLAVGDESFQKKCIAWIENFLAGGGTLLMVSHSMYHVQKLCKKAIWMHEGKVQEAGGVFHVTQDYLAWHEQRSAREKAKRDQTGGEDGLYRIDDMAVSGQNGDRTIEIEMGGDLHIELNLQSPDGRAPVGLVGLVRADGGPIYGVASESGDASPVADGDGRFTYRLAFRNLPLLPGSYSVRGHAMDPEGYRIFDTREIAFKVRGETRDMGFIRLDHDWLE
jgi:lipopolysaccharide transport system ATP-binding protein